MRTFLTPDGKAGVAIKHDGDIVSVFKHRDAAKMKFFSKSALALATQEGGNKLDAFDTVLPGLYSNSGFRAVARLAFSDQFAPEGWDYKHYASFNGGRPDVVFMVHDPEHAGPYHPGDGERVATYEEGQAAQQRALDEIKASRTRKLWAAVRAQAEESLARLGQTLGFDPSEPRDEHGQWTEGGGDGEGGSTSGETEPSAKLTVADVHGMKSEFARIAQGEYDGWQQDENGVDEELGTGGICDRIANGIAATLSDKGVEVADGGQPGDEHAWVIANLKEGVYSIDISPYVYETGGGYNWTKLPDVTITPDHVSIDKIEEPMSDEEFADRYQERSFSPRVKFDPSEPRDEQGRWTDGGGEGSSSAPDKPAEESKPQLDPKVIEVGGDSWNQATARRLEREYQEARPKLEALSEQAVGKTTEAGEPDEDEDAEPPYDPQSWDELSDADQEAGKSHYVENNKSAYFDNEVQNWYDNGDALDDAKSQLNYDFNKGSDQDWAIEAIEDYRSESDQRIPYTTKQLLDAITLDYQNGYQGNGDFSVVFDDDKLKEPSNLPPPEQGTFPGIEPPDPSKQLTEDMRDGLTKAIEKAFDKKADKIQGDMPAPEYLMDSALEFLEMDWDSNMTDKQKFEFIKDHTDIIGSPDEQSSSSASDTLTVDELPTKYDPLNETSGVNYRRTQALARYLSVERTKEMLTARNLPVPSDQTIASIDKRLWSAWKDSSISQGGKLLQVATSDELQGRMNAKTSTEIDAEEMRRWANRAFPEIGGYVGVKAYVRAKWETTQYLLDKAGVKDIGLFRGITVDRDKYTKTFAPVTRHVMNSEKVTVGGQSHTYFPTLDVERNGAASTTTDVGVANHWKQGQPNRIILRAHIPRTAAISVPAYGVNVQSEHEVVVAGTAWKGWDAWADRAPTFEEVPLRAAA